MPDRAGPTQTGPASPRTAGSGSEAVWPKVEPILASTAFLALVVAIAAWNVSFEAPSTGLDASWIAGMSMAADRGFDFGTQVIWTYGPLSFLQLDGTYYSDLSVLGYCWQAFLLLAYCASLIWALRRSLNTPLAVVITFVTVIGMPSTFVVLVLPAVWCLAALSEDPPAFAPRLVSVGGGALGALECLIRLSFGPVILVMCAVTLLALPRRSRELPVFAATALFSFIVLWFVSGQGVGNFADWVRGAAQVVMGYSAAMGADSAPDIYVPLALIVSVALVAASVVAARPGPARVAAGVVMALPAFSIFKEAVVRFDDGHVAVFCATAAPLAMAIPWRGSLRPVGVALLVAVGGLGLANNLSVFSDQSFNPISHVEDFASETHTLVSSSRRESIIGKARFGMALNYRLEPRTLALLRGHGVHVDPWEAGVVWAYGLRWKPLPVFQDYQAYTAALDDDNADALRSRSGPDRILRENVPAVQSGFPVSALDNRHPAWDPPAAAVAMLCNYTPLSTTSRWQVLGRSANRCGKERPMRSVQTSYGRGVAVPRAGPAEVVYAKIRGVEVSGFERVRSFFYKARLRHAGVNDGQAIWRLVPGTAENGLIMTVPAGADFPGLGYGLSAGARRLTLYGGSGDITIDFYALPIESREPSRAPGRRG